MRYLIFLLLLVSCAKENLVIESCYNLEKNGQVLFKMHLGERFIVKDLDGTVLNDREYEIRGNDIYTVAWKDLTYWGTIEGDSLHTSVTSFFLYNCNYNL